MSTALAFNDRKVGAACTRFEVRQDFSYDPLAGRLSSEDTTLRQWNVAQPVQKWSQSYLYDGAGRITQVTYPYCLLNCAAVPRTVTTTYDKGRPTAVSGFATGITYNDNGTLNTIRHANNVLFVAQTDPTGIARTAALQADLGTSKLWPREDYVYDGAGNIQKIGAKSFTYDLSSRLSSALVPSAGALPYQAYTYDAFNNLTRIARGSSATNISTYVDYGAAPATNRLQGASYDGSGNLLAYQGSSYSWDRLQHLSSVTTGSETWVHTYNASGERVWSWRTSPSRLDTYAVRSADGKVLTDFTQVGLTYTWEDYVYREGQLLGAALSDGSVRHFDVDHLGSVRLETSSAGAVAYRDFWPYGEEATPPSGTEQMKFTGHERDLGDPSSTADDLDYMHARYYKPLFGRMISADPVSGDSGRPQTWNKYSYGGNNPLSYTDPSGAVLEFSAKKKEDLDAVLEVANTGLFGQALVVDSNGVASLQPTGQQGPPTEAQSRTAGLLGSVIDDPGITKVNVDSNSTVAMIGSRPDHLVDPADIAKFGNGPGPTQSSVLVHEIVEQFGIQVKGLSGSAAHTFGLKAEAYITGFDRPREVQRDIPGGGRRIESTYKRGDEVVNTVLIYLTNNVVSFTRKP